MAVGTLRAPNDPQRRPFTLRAFAFAGIDIVVCNESTRELLGWTPTGLPLLEDLEQGHYFA